MLTESPPLVSVIIIFLNERRFLGDAIKSVFQQTYTHWELLLVDDGSSDGSTDTARRVAEEHSGRVRYIEHSGHVNQGMSASRNLGWTEAHGSLIAFLDADDVWLPQKLARQVEMLLTHSVDMVYGNTEFWYSWTGNPQDSSRDCLRGIGVPKNTIFVPPQLMLRCYPLGPAPSPATCSILIRKETMQKVGGYEVDFRGMFEDQAFLAKLYLQARIFASDECHDRYRMHVDSCVSRSTRVGRNDEATHRFLNWLQDYLRREAVQEPVLWHSLRRALRPYRHPYSHALVERLRNVIRRTGHVSWRWYNRYSRTIRQKSSGTITAVPNPVLTSDRFRAGKTTVLWSATRTARVEVHVNAPDGPLFAIYGPVGSSETGLWVLDGTCFYLQDVSNDRPLIPEHTLDVVRVYVVPVITPEAISPGELPPELLHEGKAGGYSEASNSAEATLADSALSPRLPATPGRAVILLYHRIADVRSDPWTLAVTSERFAEQLKLMREYGTVLSLPDLVSGLRDGTLPDRSVAVTFDDGYKDNLDAASPLLEQHEVPATFFITTNILTGNRNFWWDDLERLFLQTASLPPTLSFSIGGEVYRWELGDDAEYPESVQPLYRNWRAWGEPDPTMRHLLFRSVYGLLYPLGENERQDLVDLLLKWAALTRDPVTRLTLTSGELLELASGRFAEIGSHTVTHTLLAGATPTKQQQEIQQGKDELEQILRAPVTSFAYPFGKHGDYSQETVEFVRASGFRSACSNFPGIVKCGVDVFQLPRMFMGNWTADEFGPRLAGWFEN